MVWEWQVWRSFDDIRETFEEKGWKPGLLGHNGSGAIPPLLAESGNCCIAFFKRDPETGECWFELRDRVQSKRVFVQGTDKIPRPEQAAELIASYGGPLYEITNPDDRSMYGLPVAPVFT